MLRALLWIALSAAGAVASIASVAQSPLVTAPEAFGSYEKAARAALRVAMANPASSTHEYCGAVLAIDGRFYFTEPVSSGSEHECTVHVPLPQGLTLAAIYHTHTEVVPVLETRALRNVKSYFSRVDLATARALKVPSFIGLHESKEVVVYEPPRRIEGSRFAARAHK